MDMADFFERIRDCDGDERGLLDFLVIQNLTNPGSIDPNTMAMLVLMAGGGGRHRRFDNKMLLLMLLLNSSNQAAQTAMTTGGVSPTPCATPLNPLVLAAAFGLFGHEPREGSLIAMEGGRQPGIKEEKIKEDVEVEEKGAGRRR